MKILILGLNHQIQKADILSGGDEIEGLEQQQKERFAEYLARLMQERQVGFIGEEAEHCVDLIAQRVAAHLGCGHMNIEMSPALRQTRGIPTDYTREDRPYTPEQRERWHSEREQFMFEQMTHHAACENAVLLCGREHIEALAAFFKDAGHLVETDDLNRQDWYIEDWLRHVLQS